MLQIRDISGNLLPIPDSFRFVEITDIDGKIARVFYQDDAGTVHAISPKDPEAVRYGQMFKVSWCELIKLPKNL